MIAIPVKAWELRARTFAARGLGPHASTDALALVLLEAALAGSVVLFLSFYCYNCI